MVFGSYWHAGARRVTWDPLVTGLRLDYVGLSGKPGWSGGSAWYGWYGPCARLGLVGLVRPWCTARPVWMVRPWGTARPGMAGTVLLHGSAPPSSVGKLEFLGTAGAWPTVFCVVHGSPLWLMTLPFLCQGGSWVLIPVVW